VSLAKVRDALIVMVSFLVLLWVIQAANWADSYRLDTSLGIVPHNLSHLGDIFTAPFLHASWQHIEGNSIPLLVLGFLAAYRGIAKFLTVTLIVIVTSGLAVWLFQSSNTVTVGASGLVFGYFGYVLVRGLFDRNWVDIAVGVAAAAAYYYILSVAIPGTPGVSWIGHLGGLVGGVLAGWLLRTRRTPLGAPAAAGAVTGPGGSAPKASPTAFKPTSDNPRAQLHQELDDMDL
jgi:membrane associated rhomboid family serine protease